MQEFLRFPYLNSVSITAFLVAGILGGIIGYSTQHNTKLCNDRYSLLSVLWADRLSDVIRAVEAIVEGTDVMFHSTLDGEINLTQSLDGIESCEVDDPIYFIQLDGEYLGFYYRGNWFTRSNNK